MTTNVFKMARSVAVPVTDQDRTKSVLEKLGFQYTHDEFFPALGMHIPYYLLTKPQEDGRN